MALFSYKRYYKPGKGVEKDAPEKNAFFKFFELFGRKFWRFIEVNLIFLIILLPMLMAIYAQVYDVMYTQMEKRGNMGTCASYTDGNFTVTAKEPGATGNDYMLDIDADKFGTYTVTLYTDRGEAAADENNTIDTWFVLEKVGTVEELAAYENDYVTFSGAGPLTSVRELQLSGGDGIMSMFTPLLYLTMIYYARVPIPIQVFLLILSVLCYGPCKCGITYVLRNFSRESHSWLSDVWDKAKENWKQGMLFGIVDCLVAVLVVFNLTFQPPENIAAAMKVAKYITLLAGMFYVFMRKYIYLMIVTVKLNVRSIVKNAWLLAFIGIYRNFFSGLGNLLIWVVAYLLIMIVHPFMEIIFLGLLIYSFTGFLSISASYPLVDKYLVKPIEEMLAAQEAEAEAAAAGETQEVQEAVPQTPKRDTNLF